MYIEASSPRTTGDAARLISPLYQDNQAVCLSFWYHMYGNGIGTLNVYAQVRTNMRFCVSAVCNIKTQLHLELFE